MNITPDLVKAIVKTCNSDERFAEEFTKKLDKLQYLSKELLRCKQGIEKIRNDARLAIDNYNHAIIDVQKECPHYVKEASFDVYERYITCNLCGADC